MRPFAAMLAMGCCAGFACFNGTGALSVDVHGCGNSTEYCPEGSAARTPTPAGFFANPTLSGLFFNATRCEPGRYCANGVASECPAGRYGAQPGLTSDICSGSCSAGYFCPAGSSSPAQFDCSDGPAYFCPEVCVIARHCARVLAGNLWRHCYFLQ